MGNIVSMRNRLASLEKKHRPVRSRAEDDAEWREWVARHMAMSDAEFDKSERELLLQYDVADESEFAGGLPRDNAKGAVEECFHSMRWRRSEGHVSWER